MVTQGFTPLFEKTIAIEPNLFLLKKLHQAVPEAIIHDKTIMETQLEAKGDLILCSHVFYYIDPKDWLVNLEHLVAWLAADGVAVIVLQNPKTDCIGLLEHFLGKRFDLAALADQFAKKHSNEYETKIESSDASIETEDYASALMIAIFMLNLLPHPHPLSITELEYYISSHFLQENRKYHFSCNQDFLQIRRCTMMTI